MTLNNVKAGFYFVVFFFSVVHNVKRDTQHSIQEPISEIKKNISFVNHLLQDLLQKYAQLKEIANADNENIDQKIDKKTDHLLNQEPKSRSKAKVKLSKPLEPVATTLFETDESLERSDSEVNTNEKQRAKKSSDDDDSLSPDSIDSQEAIAITRLIKHLPTTKEKVTGTMDYSFEKVILGNPKEVKDHQDLEKVLVIHLGSTKGTRTKKNRSSQVILQSMHKKTQTTKSMSPGVMRHHDSELEEEQEMQTEMLRMKQLREAWGKACSQVVARKCQYALKAVLKDVCKSGRKCSDDFNDHFTNNGIAACNKEFNSAVKNRGRLVDYQYSEEYANTQDQQSSELTGAQFIDYTREGYLDMTCLEALSNIKEPNIERAQPAKTDAKAHEVNLLRDKYEKACKKASYQKCITACNSTSKTTCDKYHCITEKTKALKQSCKRRCKESNSYSGGGGNSGSSSGSGSSSLSSSNSS